MSHNDLTSLSARGVPTDNLDNHPSKSLYDFSEVLPEYLTLAGIAGGGGGGAEDVGDSSEPLLLEIDVEVVSGSTSILYFNIQYSIFNRSFLLQSRGQCLESSYNNKLGT
jgi:hypothetical protein